MGQTKKAKRKNSFLLPLIAGISVVLALIVVFFIPKDKNERSGTTSSGKSHTTGTNQGIA